MQLTSGDSRLEVQKAQHFLNLDMSSAYYIRYLQMTPRCTQQNNLSLTAHEIVNVTMTLVFAHQILQLFLYQHPHQNVAGSSYRTMSFRPTNVLAHNRTLTQTGRKAMARAVKATMTPMSVMMSCFDQLEVLAPVVVGSLICSRGYSIGTAWTEA